MADSNGIEPASRVYSHTPTHNRLNDTNQNADGEGVKTFAPTPLRANVSHVEHTKVNEAIAVGIAHNVDDFMVSLSYIETTC